jgi:hypothetical protein
MIESLFYLIIWLVVLGLLYWLGVTLINALPQASDSVKPVLRIVLLVVCVLFAVYLLVGYFYLLVGYLSRPCTGRHFHARNVCVFAPPWSCGAVTV